jgi:chemotaxis protein MotA
MFFFIGLVVVFGCVLGSFSVHGDLRVLWQPLEYVIILGSGIGAFIISNPVSVLKECMHSFKYLIKGKPYSKADYMDLLKLLFELFKLIKTKGVLNIESHIENPKESDIFNKYPKIMANSKAVDFICDNLKLMTLGVDSQYVFSDCLDQEIEIYEKEHEEITKAMTTFGESLPALGIVAAVLGVIVTMKSISEPPAVLGGLIAAALVGTFAGILMSYGVFSPIASFVGAYQEAEIGFYYCIKAVFISHLQGNAPSISVEMARKNIPLHERPSFAELEIAINS